MAISPIFSTDVNNHVLTFLEPFHRSQLAQTDRKWSHLVAQDWPSYAASIGCPLNDESSIFLQIQSFIADLNAKANNIPFFARPADITEILNSKDLTIYQINQLQTWLVAQDTLTVWRELVVAVHVQNPAVILEGPGILNTSEEVIQRASEFSAWFEANQVHLAQLIHLNLAHCLLTSLPAEIGRLTQLTRLSLSHNLLQSLPSWIGNLTQLTDLHLGNNQLQSLPSEFGNLIQLTRLNLSRNQLKSLPNWIGNLTLLTNLYLNFNQLQSLPSQIGLLTQLTELDLMHNQLQSLPSEFGNLIQLTSLDLSNNQLQSLPSQIGNLGQLISLHLTGNQLQSLPMEIGNLGQLIVLSLSRNQLKSVPSQIGNLNQLASLYLRDNQLQTLPNQIGNLNQLRFLYLENNQLKSLPNEVHKLPQLLILELDNNKLPLLTSVKAEAFIRKKWIAADISYTLNDMSDAVARNVHKIAMGAFAYFAAEAGMYCMGYNSLPRTALTVVGTGFDYGFNSLQGWLP